MRHGDGAGFRSGQVFQIFFGENGEDALQFAREAGERIPRSAHREIGAHRMEHGDALEVIALGAEQLDFAGQKLLVKHRELHVLFHALDAAHAGAKVVDFAAQHAPELLAFGRRASSLVDASASPLRAACRVTAMLSIPA